MSLLGDCQLHRRRGLNYLLDLADRVSDEAKLWLDLSKDAGDDRTGSNGNLYFQLLARLNEH